jgi:hypothetical protein
MNKLPGTHTCVTLTSLAIPGYFHSGIGKPPLSPLPLKTPVDHVPVNSLGHPSPLLATSGASSRSGFHQRGCCRRSSTFLPPQATLKKVLPTNNSTLLKDKHSSQLHTNPVSSFHRFSPSPTRCLINPLPHTNKSQMKGRERGKRKEMKRKRDMLVQSTEV